MGSRLDRFKNLKLSDVPDSREKAKIKKAENREVEQKTTLEEIKESIPQNSRLL